MRISEFTSTNRPVVVVVHIANPVAINLIKVLLEQESRIVVVDRLTTATKQLLKEVKHENLLFLDIESTTKNIDQFQKVDYIYDFLYHLVVGSDYPFVNSESFSVRSLTNKEFIKQSDFVDMYLKLAVEFNSKYTLVTAGYLGQLLQKPSEHNLQLQRYAESLFNEYSAKSKFNGRIVRMAEVIGDNMDLSIPTFVTRFFRELVLQDKIKILGEGLQNNYTIDIQDATYGLLKSSFSKKLVGKTVLLSNYNPVTTLSLAYTALELTADEKVVEFVDINESGFDLSFQQDLEEMSVAQNLSEFGWEPKISLEESLKKALAFIANKLNTIWRPARVDELSIEESERGEDIGLLEPGSKYKEIKSIKQGVFWSLVYGLYSVFIVWPISILLGIGSLKEHLSFKKVFWGIIRLLLIIAVIVVLVPYAQIAYAVFGLKHNLGLFKQALSSYNVPLANKYINKASSDFARLQGGVDALFYYKYIGLEQEYENARVLLKGLSYELSSIQRVVKASEPMMSYLKELKIIDINNPAGQSTAQYFSYVKQISQNAFLVIDAYQDKEVANKILEKVNKDLLPVPVKGIYMEYLPTLKYYSDALDVYKDIYPHLPYLLGYKKRTNYVFVFQNNDEIRATGGWLTAYSIVGIENGALKEFEVDDVYNVDGQIAGIDAPKDMKKMLAINKIKLSLSNWDPQLNKTANNIEVLLAQADKLTHLDVLVAVNFSTLEDILKITGPVYVPGYGQITSDNLFDTVVAVHKNFKPGESEKVGVLASLVPPLVSKIQQLDTKSKVQLLNVVKDLVSSHDVQIYSNNTYLDEFLRAKNMYYFFNPDNKFIALVDWNFGGNKVNRFIERSTEAFYYVSKKELSLNFAYKNTSTHLYYPEGDYKNIFRFYFPATWKIGKVSGLKNSKVYAYDSNIHYVIGEVLVPIKKTNNVSISFTNVDMQNNHLLYLKQSGFRNETLIVNLEDRKGILEGKELQKLGYNLSGWTWVRVFKVKKDVVLK